MLNVILRYPATGHELDVDSFFIHALSGSILADGHAEWTVSPLSYFGWFPLSYPSAGPFFLASISGLSGLSIETSILVMTMLLGPLGIAGAFVMAREVRGDNAFALSVALLYGLAPRFLSITLWTASTRNIFTALLPILIWALLRSYRKGTPSTVTVLLASSIILAATHRLVVLVMVVLVAFFVAVIFRTGWHLLRTRFPGLILSNSVRRATPHLALAAILISALTTLFGTDVLAQYSSGELAAGADVGTQLTNLSVSIARSVGIALPLTLVGVVVITRQRNKTIAEPFLTITLIGLVPTFFLRQYTGFYILPFLAIFGGLGFVGILGALRKKPRMAAAVAASLAVCVAGFSAFVLGIETQRIPVLDDATYSTGLYVQHLRAPGTMVANDGLTGVRVAAVAGVYVLPVGGAGTTFQNPELLAYRFYTPDDVKSRLVQVPLGDLTIESDSLWEALGINAELDWVTIAQSAYWQIPTRLDQQYQPSYLLESDSAAGRFVAYGNEYCSNLALSAHFSAYRIYDNGAQSVWWLRAPGTESETGSLPAPCP